MKALIRTISLDTVFCVVTGDSKIKQIMLRPEDFEWKIEVNDEFEFELEKIDGRMKVLNIKKT